MLTAAFLLCIPLFRIRPDVSDILPLLRDDSSNILDAVPEYQDEPFTTVNDNVPAFTEREKSEITVFEQYSSLDRLGRCGAAYAMVCRETMPDKEKEYIGNVRPTGWHTVKYSDRIQGNYLYNRCHLIGYQLSGENANKKNLITGTRYLNINGMLPFENQIADYVYQTSNHVRYRVTPVFKGKNLIASGVHMEAWSMEDQGHGICFNVYCYNVQPGVIIDYADGESQADPEYALEAPVTSEFKTEEQNNSSEAPDQMELSKKPDKNFHGYVLNTNTGKIHRPDCPNVDDMRETNKEYYTGTIKDLIAEGYSPCHNCLRAYVN